MRITSKRVLEWTGRITADSRLDAVDPGSILVFGPTWIGELQPIIDSHVQAFDELITPLTLTPSVVTGALDIGSTWASTLRSEVRDRVITSRSGAAPQANPGYVSAEAIVRESETLHQLMNSPMKTAMREQPWVWINDVAACLRRLRRASADITRQVGSRTRDSRPPGVMGFSRAIGNGSRAITPQMVMDAANGFWGSRRAQ